jgi:hypothetical protein
MAKPRIFLSSTCFDLSDARAALTRFLEGYGFEVLNSQDKKFGVKPKVHSHDACLEMMQNADYVVLIIGGRRGGTYVGSDKSITNEEIKAAQKLERPVFAFLDKGVEALRQTYRKNPAADFKPAVDDNRVFDFVDWVASGHEDNWLRPFDNVTDIQDALRAQFAYILLLYSQDLRKKPGAATPKRGQLVPFPSTMDGAPGDTEEERTVARAGLRQVYDSLKRLLAADVTDGVKQEQLKAIWVVARHGTAESSRLKVKEDRFKASAWGRSRGQRVFNQITECGVRGEYDYDEDNNGAAYGTVVIVFDGKDFDGYPAEALQSWVQALITRYGDDEGLDLFKKLDMRLFADAPVAPKVRLKPKKLVGSK